MWRRTAGTLHWTEQQWRQTTIFQAIITYCNVFYNGNQRTEQTCLAFHAESFQTLYSAASIVHVTSRGVCRTGKTSVPFFVGKHIYRSLQISNLFQHDRRSENDTSLYVSLTATDKRLRAANVYKKGQSNFGDEWHRCEQGNCQAPNLPFPWGTGVPVYYNVTRDHTCPCQTHLSPSNSFSRVHECDRRHTYRDQAPMTSEAGKATPPKN